MYQLYIDSCAKDGGIYHYELNEKGALTFHFGDAEVVLTKEDLLIDMAQTEGYVSEGDNPLSRAYVLNNQGRGNLHLA